MMRYQIFSRGRNLNVSRRSALLCFAFAGWICLTGATAKACEPSLNLATPVALADGIPQPYEGSRNDGQAGLISGQITDDAGQPLLNPVVIAQLSGGGPTVKRRAKIEKSGEFKFGNLQPGAYTIRVTAPGYIVASISTGSANEASVYRPGDHLSIVMSKGGVVTGKVMGADGSPLVAARVRAIRVGEVGSALLASGAQRERLTDDRGIYRIYGLEPGRYLISARKAEPLPAKAIVKGSYAPTYFPSSTSDTATKVNLHTAEEISGLDIRFRAESGYGISGLIAGVANVSSLPGALFAALRSVTANSVQDIAVAQKLEQGYAFEFYGVSNGEYELSAYAQSANGVASISVPRRVIVNGSSLMGLTLSLTAPASIIGKLMVTPYPAPSPQTSCRKLVPGATEILISPRSINEDAQSQRRSTVSDAIPDTQGNFMLQYLEDGRYLFDILLPREDLYLQSISLNQPGSRSPAKDVSRNGLLVRAGDKLQGLTIEIAQGAAALRGRITPGPADGQSLPPLSVYLVPVEPRYANDLLHFARSRVSQDGTYVLSQVPAGRYWLLVRAESSAELGEFSLRTILLNPNSRALLVGEAKEGNRMINLEPCQSKDRYDVPFTPIHRAGKPR